MQGGQVWLGAIRFGIFFVVLMLGCQDSTTQLRIPGWVFFIFFWFRTMSVLIMSDSLPMPLAVAISCLISLIYLWYLYDFGDDMIQFLKTWPGREPGFRSIQWLPSCDQSQRGRNGEAWECQALSHHGQNEEPDSSGSCYPKRQNIWKCMKLPPMSINWSESDI